MNKKKISLFLSFTLFSSMFVGAIPAQAASYSDVDEGHWAYQWVEKMNAKQYIHGYPDGTYKPAQKITRAEFFTIFNYVFNATQTTEIPFTDVNDGDWYFEQIARAYKAGYVTGYEDNTIKPNDNITRQEACVVIAKVFNVPLDENSELTFTDSSDVAAWAKTYVAAASKYGVVTGNEDGTFKPSDNLLRAEAAVMIEKAYEQYEAGTFKPSQTISLPTVSEAKGEADFSKFNVTNPESAQYSVGVTLEGNTAGAPSVTYTKDGTEITTTVEKLLSEKLTPEQFNALNLKFTFPNAKDDSVVDITVMVYDDNGNEVGTKTYHITFTPTTEPSTSPSASPTTEPSASPSTSPSTAPTSKPSGSFSGSGSSGGSSTPTPIVRDRVVEALTAYQAGKTDALTSDTTVLWSKDQLDVILSNDGNETFDTAADQMAYVGNGQTVLNGIVSADYAKLKPIYNDVIKYVIDKNADLKGEKITTANKKDYVMLFRAMVKVIDASATSAMTVYNDPANKGLSAQEKYDKYKTEAQVAGLPELTAFKDQISSTVWDKYCKVTSSSSVISALAVNYIDAIFNPAKGDSTLKDELSKLGTVTIDNFTSTLAKHLLYK